MNYTKVYNDLIEKRRKYPLDRGLSGCENHHIVPVSEGGTDDAENIIRFTVKEHIFAHQLLARIYDDVAMWGAVNLMLTVKGVRRCLRLASLARTRHNELIRGENNPFYGKHHSEETKHILSDKTKEYNQLHGNSFMGKTHSDESKKRMSESHKGRTSWLGKHHTEETKRKISKSLSGKVSGFKGRHHSEEAKKKQSIARKGCPGYWLGKHLSQETKKKLSKIKTGVKLSESHCLHISEATQGEKNPFYGKHHSDEMKQHWSEIRRGRTLSDSARQKLSESLKGRVPWNKGVPCAEKVKMKISEKNKGKVVSSETRKKLSDALKGRKIRPEIVEKMRQSQLNNKSSMVVVQYDKNMNFVAEYKSTRDASRITGFSCGNISRCCNGKLKTVKGFIWRFK